MSVWEALVELDRTRPRVGDQLVSALREAITQGRLAPGTRLPSTRDLATDLGVSRGLVVGAYEQLTAEGRLLTRRGSGTVVAAVTAPVQRRRSDQPDRPATVAPLRPGVPDLGMFPRTAWRRAYETALTSALDADFDYGDATGTPRLRRELSGYLGRVRAALVPPEGLIVTAGVTQGLALLAKVLREQDVRRVALEDPGPAALREHLGRLGLEVVPVPVDDDGLDVAALARSRCRAVVVTPAHQFPTGVRAGAAAARRADRLGPQGRRARSSRTTTTRSTATTASPSRACRGSPRTGSPWSARSARSSHPGLRLGWLAAPPAAAPSCARRRPTPTTAGRRCSSWRSPSSWPAAATTGTCAGPAGCTGERRDAVVAALRRHLPGPASAGIAAGLHLVVELPPEMDDRAVSQRAGRVGLGPVALSSLRVRKGAPGLVLGYAAHTPHELARAVRNRSPDSRSG